MLVIFDWDGTVVDSSAKIVRCLAQASEDAGLPLLSAQEYQHIIGLGLPEAIEQLYPDVDAPTREQVRLAYVDHFIGDQTPTQLFEGVEQGITALRQQGYSLAVATGKSRRGMDRVLAELDMQDVFDITRCADETRSKPHPLMLEQILDHTGVGVERAVMVGDTSFDLEMALNASMRSVGVSYGAHSQTRLAQYQPLTIVHSFSEVVAAVTEALAP